MQQQSSAIDPNFVMPWDVACHILHVAHDYIATKPALAMKMANLKTHYADNIEVDVTRLDSNDMYAEIYHALKDNSDSIYVERSLIISKEAQQKIMWREQLAHHSSLITGPHHIFPSRNVQEQQGIMRHMADTMMQVLNPASANFAQYETHKEFYAHLQHIKTQPLYAPVNGIVGWLDKNLNPDRKWLRNIRDSIFNDFCGAIEDLTDVRENIGSIINAAAYEKKQTAGAYKQ